MTYLNPKLKRLINVAGVAAIGHLLAVLLVPYAAKNYGSEIAANIALVDSSILLISSMLAFGLSLTVTRDVSQNSNWVSIVSDCISARLVLSFFIQIASVFLYYIGLIDLTVFICFLLSPIIALNLDFVLYGRDMPVKAAYASFIRVSIPVLIFVLIPLFLGFNIDYLYLVVIFYLISSLFVFKSIGFFPQKLPNFSCVFNYKPVIFIGLATLVIAFKRLGFLSFLEFKSDEIVFISTVLKFYLAFVAIRRLFIQTFYVHLLDRKIYLKVEFFCFFVAVLISLLCLVFPDLISLMLFGSENDSINKYIQYFAVLIIGGSFYSTADARLFLKNKDRLYYSAAFISFSFWLVCILIFVLMDLNPALIILILAASEALLAFSYKFFLENK